MKKKLLKKSKKKILKNKKSPNQMNGLGIVRTRILLLIFCLRELPIQSLHYGHIGMGILDVLDCLVPGCEFLFANLTRIFRIPGYQVLQFGFQKSGHCFFTSITITQLFQVCIYICESSYQVHQTLQQRDFRKPQFSKED